MLFIFFIYVGEKMELQDLTRVMSDDIDIQGMAHNEDSAKNKKRARESTQSEPKAKRKAKKGRAQEVDDDLGGGFDLDPEQLSLDEIKEMSANDPIPRRKKIQKIEAWFATFPNQLEKIRENVELEDMQEAQLDSLQAEIKHVMGSAGGGALSETIPLAGLTIYEELATFCGINVKGISNLAFDPNFSQACKEVLLEYMDLTYVPPHYRILFMVGNATYHLHSKNSAKDASKSNSELSTPAKSSNGNPNPEDAEMLQAGKDYSDGKKL